MFEKLLKMRNDDKGLILGADKTCYADYWLLEELDILKRLDANCLDKFPALQVQNAFKGFSKQTLYRPTTSACRRVLI